MVMAPVAPSALGEKLERICAEVVDRAPHLHLWETDYALWISMRLVTVLMEQHQDLHAHERVLNTHGVMVSDLERVLCEHHSVLYEPFLKYVKQPGKQNEIGSDIQVFAQKITDTPREVSPHRTPNPWEGMPPIEALVEMKVPVGSRFRSIKYARDVVKVAVTGEFYRWRFNRPVPYLGAWILDLNGYGPAAFEPYYLPPLPGTEHVRVVLFQPGCSPKLLRQIPVATTGGSF